MQIKKTYKAPKIHSEDVSIGVFGSYGDGGGDDGGNTCNPIQMFNPWWGYWCCN